MKKTFLFGMAFVTLVSAQTFAAGAPKAGFKDYVTEINKHYVDPATGQFKAGAKDAYVAKMNIAGDKAKLLDQAMKSPEKKNTLMMLAAAKEAATSKSDKVTADAADASVALVLRGAMMTKIEGKNVEDPMVISNQAIKKIEAKAEEILTQFNGSERTAYKDVLVEFDKLVSTSKTGSYEELFLQSIQNSRGVTRDKAIEIAKKLRDCV
ncbi:hypothetical protein [Bdellovibrio sp. HCB209]|uniref:hypothetical protein n=1 Tax=Bdellovibrio sp. HCB209 TaxID=3394354 RepID=UPI0039B3F455